MASIHLISDRSMNKVVSHLPGVRARVGAQALDIGVNAERRLRSHRKTGDHRIGVEMGSKGVDAFVNMDGTAPAALEFGHWVHNAKKPTWVDGIFALTGAMGVKRGR